ncbi:hypothetical protein SAMN02927903_00407 [Flavobacterium caeni]|uniref:Uncharacterized protein n=1 Tax=Flavobacterium caeni TaxID=490189 RepID=A0A1G5BKY9_9FLAO|nr:hypothetical protein SAMN02927903_00407 [Flavobacterium caeni]
MLRGESCLGRLFFFDVGKEVGWISLRDIQNALRSLSEKPFQSKIEMLLFLSDLDWISLRDIQQSSALKTLKTKKRSSELGVFSYLSIYS